jgi:hypothetical protein
MPATNKTPVIDVVLAERDRCDKPQDGGYRVVGANQGQAVERTGVRALEDQAHADRRYDLQ